MLPTAMSFSPTMYVDNLLDNFPVIKSYVYTSVLVRFPSTVFQLVLLTSFPLAYDVAELVQTRL